MTTLRKFVNNLEASVATLKDTPSSEEFFQLIRAININTAQLLTALDSANPENLAKIQQHSALGIQDYGAFVDLGGIDGLLHITDMAWR